VEGWTKKVFFSTLSLCYLFYMREFVGTYLLSSYDIINKGRVGI